MLETWPFPKGMPSHMLPQFEAEGVLIGGFSLGFKDFEGDKNHLRI